MLSLEERNKETTMKDILIIHGWMNNIKVFGSLVEELKKDYNIHYLLYPGFDYEVRDKEKCNLDFMVNECKDFVNSCEIDIILAHSLGGTIVLLASPYFLNEPSIILLSPVLKNVNNIQTQIVKYLLPLKDSKLFNKHLKRYFITKFVEISGIDDETTKQNLVEDILNFDLCMSKALLKSISRDITRMIQQNSYNSNSIILCYGDEDRIINPRTIERACKELCIYDIVEFKDGNHSLFINNKHEIVNIINIVKYF